MKRIDTASLSFEAQNLRAGERILLSGVAYTARDAAHARISAAIDSGLPLPFELKGAAVYYAGPTPAPPGMAIGSCGPTTSGRMDIYTPRLIDMGLCCTIGKGNRSREVKDAIIRNKAVYLCALGGAGALACASIRSCEVVAYEDLGCESVKRIMFDDFPLITAIDCEGGSVFTSVTLNPLA